MKNIKFLFFILILMVGCSNSTDFTTLINRVPIHNEALGLSNIHEIDSLWCDYDNGVTMLNWVTDKDDKNSYGLNDFFDYSLIANQLKTPYSLLDRYGSFVFSKRLPKIGESEILLYYIEQYDERDQERFPRWILLRVDASGEISGSLVVAEKNRLEMDQIREQLFFMDNNSITTKVFLAPIEGDPEWWNQEYLYCRNASTISLLEVLK